MLDNLSSSTISIIEEIQKSAISAEELNKTESPKKEADPAIFADLIAKLADLLEDDDSEAQDCLEELMKISDKPELKEMAEMVSNYEFEEALEVLQNKIKNGFVSIK